VTEADEILAEFVQESTDLLETLDVELVELENDPTNMIVIGSVFRAMHTIKGVAGFLNLERITAVSHQAENLLSQVRDGVVPAGTDVITALLAAVDALKDMTGHVSATGNDGQTDYTDLAARLAALASGHAAPAAAPAPAEAPVDAQTPAPAEPVEASVDVPVEAPAAAAQPAAPAPAQGSADGTGVGTLENIRVDVEVLDSLMNVVSELVLVRNQLRATLTGQATNTGLGRLSQLTSELQETVMKTRLQPIGTLWNRYPRIIRDLGQTLGKKARLDLIGADTELDRALLDALRDPLTHIVRNSVDHGLETPDERVKAGKPAEGTITLSARHDNGHVVVDIADDGAGINPDKIKAVAISRGLITPAAAATLSDDQAAQLIFTPGLSTAQTVTNVSGRGVGMDVVKTNIERIGGTIAIRSAVGIGTTITATIPLTLTIVPALIARTDGWRYALPQSNVSELVSTNDADTHHFGGSHYLRLRGDLLPLVDLAATINPDHGTTPTHGAAAAGDGSGPAEPVNRVIVIAQDGNERFGVIVDEALGTEEVVVKPLDSLMARVPLYAGSTIMGDGTVALVLDVSQLAPEPTDHAGTDNEQLHSPGQASGSDSTAGDTQNLVVCQTPQGNIAIPISDVARLEEFPSSMVEMAAGRPVVQYRNGLLHLSDPYGALGASERITVIVQSHTSGDTQTQGLVVNDVIDVTQAANLAPGNGSTITAESLINGTVTDVIDIHQLAGSHS